MNNGFRVLAGGVAALAVFIGVGFAIGAFDNESDNDGTRDAVADEAKCAAGATDCQEPGNDALGMCISEDDPNYDPDQPCNDVAVDPVCDADLVGEDGKCEDDPDAGAGLNMCAADVPDCNDMGLGGGTENSCLAGATDCNDTPGEGECAPLEDGGDEFCNDDADSEVRVHEIILTDMETNIGSVASIVSSEYVEWPDSCLGVETEGVACAQVITPGFKVVAEAGGQQVEYHTDMKGGFAVVN